MSILYLSEGITKFLQENSKRHILTQLMKLLILLLKMFQPVKLSRQTSLKCINLLGCIQSE